MNENRVNLDGALNWVAEYHKKVLSEFQAQYRDLPSWGPTIDLRVKGMWRGWRISSVGLIVGRSRQRDILEPKA
jgi:hypothetical protein